MNIYFEESKKNIEELIGLNDFKKAFALFLLVLARLSAEERNEMILYFDSKFHIYFSNVSHLERKA